MPETKIIEYHEAKSYASYFVIGGIFLILIGERLAVPFFEWLKAVLFR